MKENVIFYEKKRGSKPYRYVNTAYMYNGKFCSDLILATELHVNTDNTEGNYYYSKLEDVKILFSDLLVNVLSCNKHIKAEKFYSVK